MRHLLPILLLAAAPALAQTQTPEQAAATAAILPMLTEVSPQDGDVMAACVVAVAQPDEVAQMAAAGGPTPALGPLVSAVLARQEAIGCIEATLGR
jgi:hypothetical protein